MQELNNLALRRNFFFPSAEIYNSYSGFYEYSDLGLKIKNNIVNFWRKELVNKFRNYEIDGAIILPESVLKASGHVNNFFDPLVRCEKCNSNYRADKLLEKIDLEVNENTNLKTIDKLIKENKIVCEKCKGKLGNAYRFNLMFELNVGANNSNKAYLRPEACQNIFLDFNRIFKSTGIKLPFAIAQVGKAFRNEIAPRNALIRLRELTQMDIELFFNPSNKFKYDNNFLIPIIKNNEIIMDKTAR